MTIDGLLMLGLGIIMFIFLIATFILYADDESGLASLFLVLMMIAFGFLCFIWVAEPHAIKVNYSTIEAEIMFDECKTVDNFDCFVEERVCDGYYEVNSLGQLAHMQDYIKYKKKVDGGYKVVWYKPSPSSKAQEFKLNYDTQILLQQQLLEESY